MMASCMVYETDGSPARHDGVFKALKKRTENKQSNGECLRREDGFSQTHSFAVSSAMLSPAFVAEKVECVETRALLGDLRQPHSQLLAA